jgi:imidazolonepropionase-like amidohydrolase
MNCVHGQTIYTGTTLLEDGYIIFNEKEIVSVSRSKKGNFQGSFPVITPAFVDPHSHIGLIRSGEPRDEGEVNENIDSIVFPDVLDSVQMDDMAFQEAIEMGVLYSCVLPGSANIIGGLSAIIRNYAANSTDALIGRAGVKAALGYNSISGYRRKGQRPTTRMGVLAMLRSRLEDIRHKVQKYQKARGSKKDDIFFSPEEIMLKDILERKVCLRVHAHKIDDIASLLRLVDEFNLKITVEHAEDVNQPEIFRELAKRGIPVICGPLDSFSYKVELKHEEWRNIRHIIDAGGPYGLMSDHPISLARQLLLQTRWFLRSGLSKQGAIELITRRNAEILGIENYTGTLAKGKWASFICWNGDPFDIMNFPEVVYGEGRQLFSD